MSIYSGRFIYDYEVEEKKGGCKRQNQKMLDKKKKRKKKKASADDPSASVCTALSFSGGKINIGSHFKA